MSELFQKKQLCLNPSMQTIEQQQQQYDSEHGTLHDDDSFVVNQEGDDVDPELYCSNENEDLQHI